MRNFFYLIHLRSEAELNRCTRFCRPLPNPSAIGPLCVLTYFSTRYYYQSLRQGPNKHKSILTKVGEEVNGRDEVMPRLHLKIAL